MNLMEHSVKKNSASTFSGFFSYVDRLSVNSKIENSVALQYILCTI